MSNPATGLATFSSVTWELMRGADVRILIDPKAERTKVIELLESLLNWIKADESALSIEEHLGPTAEDETSNANRNYEVEVLRAEVGALMDGLARIDKRPTAVEEW